MDGQSEQDQAHPQEFTRGEGGPLPRRVVLGVTGSISAYKAPLIVRELIKRGVEVRVVITPAAANFVAPLTLKNLSRHPVISEMFDPQSQSDGSWHVALARWCQAMLIAPCSASTLAQLAGGQCDSALTLVALSLPSSTPLILAPAMDGEMWLHPSTRRNLARLRQDGATIIEPEHGELASGLVATGRLPDPAKIVDFLIRDRTLVGKTVLITAGPTREKLDDVRYLSNHSSGKMGYALAYQAALRGARVILVSGPVNLECPAGVERIAVESAQQMFEAVMEQDADLFIMAAAVADFRPAVPHSGKLKKEALGERSELALERTPDILAEVGRRKKPHQRVIGFALEAADYLENARRKLEGKNCDMVVLNAANQPDSGFAGDSNTVTLLKRDQAPQSFPPQSKRRCAQIILDEAVTL